MQKVKNYKTLYDKVKKQVVQLLLEEMKQRKQNSTNQNKD